MEEASWPRTEPSTLLGWTRPITRDLVVTILAVKVGLLSPWIICRLYNVLHYTMIDTTDAVSVNNQSYEYLCNKNWDSNRRHKSDQDRTYREVCNLICSGSSRYSNQKLTQPQYSNPFRKRINSRDWLIRIETREIELYAWLGHTWCRTLTDMRNNRTTLIKCHWTNISGRSKPEFSPFLSAFLQSLIDGRGAFYHLEKARFAVLDQ